MEKIIGAHNVLTGGVASNLFTKIFGIFGKCQNKSIDKLIEKGIQCFDIRVYWKNNKWHTGHGLLEYDFQYNTPECLIAHIINNVDNPYVRLILEKDGNAARFIDLCKFVEATFTNCTFLGGRRKSDWELLYDFKTDDIPMIQWVSSMAGDAWHIERFIPWLYSWRRNSENIQQAQYGINLYDFL